MASVLQLLLTMLVLCCMPSFVHVASRFEIRNNGTTFISVEDNGKLKVNGTIVITDPPFYGMVAEGNFFADSTT